VRIFSLLPRGALAVTPGRVNRAFAAAKAEASAALAPASSIEKFSPLLPGWYVLEAYSRASDVAKGTMRRAAAVHGQLDVIAELHAADSRSFNSEHCSSAAEAGQLPVLQFLRARGVPWDRWTLCFAARGGDRGVIEWCLEHGIPWNDAAYSYAAMGGHGDVIAWLRERSPYV
jgi:hypothetical protein